MSATTLTVRDRVRQLIEYIKTGHIIEAMKEYYAEDVQMQENANPPTVGLHANIEREQQFLKGVKEWRGSTVRAIALDGRDSFVEWVFDWVAIDGTPVHLEQVAVARWRDGKITHERFYYDPALLSKPEGRTA